jgi:hypothetical protein
MRMRVRRLFIALALLSCVLAGGVAWLLLTGDTSITVENATSIEPGMTLAHVEAMLGGPPRDETTGPVERLEPPEFAEPNARGTRWRNAIVELRSDVLLWESDQARVWVHFDEAGRVTDHQVFPMRRAPESPVAMFRRWLHL